MYGDQFGELVCGYCLGLKGLINTTQERTLNQNTCMQTQPTIQFRFVFVF